jgi:hypothetical protein
MKNLSKKMHFAKRQITSKIVKTQLVFSLIASTLLLKVNQIHAQITNPALEEGFGGGVEDAAKAADGSIFATIFISIWQVMISLGGLLVIFYFILGSIEWITAGGEQSKIQKGRDKIVQSVIGMFILAGSFVIIGFINTFLFKDTINILEFNF